MSKQYLNKGELIDYLVSNKNVSKETIRPKAFDEEPYANLITPYTPLIAFCRDEGDAKYKYLPINDFEYYLTCKKLDISLCVFFRMVIGCFERKLKCYLGDVFSNKMALSGDKKAKNYTWVDEYIKNKKVFDLVQIDKKISSIDDKGFLSASDEDIKRRIEALNEIRRIANAKEKVQRNGITRHYLDQHGYIPFYIAVLNLSLSKLISLLNILSAEDQSKFISIYKNTDKRYSNKKINKFYRDFTRLITIRNIASHYDTFIPYFLTTVKSDDKRNLTSFLCMVDDLKANYYNTLTVDLKLPEIKTLVLPRTPLNSGNIIKVNKLICRLIKK